MTAALRREEGWAVVTAVVAMAILLVLGLATLSFVDGQARQSAEERGRESVFNLAEATLNAQVLPLTRVWPSSPETALPGSCTETSTSERCPDAASLARIYDGPDLRTAEWTVTVRDDELEDGDETDPYYVLSEVEEEPSYDANLNRRLWLRAQARARGRSRTLVALVRLPEVVEPFPQNVITAGWFSTTNSGSRPVVVTETADTKKSMPVAVRCSDPPRSDCLSFFPERNQVSPLNYQNDFSGNAMSEAGLERVRQMAKANGTYYATCPRSITGRPVFIEQGNCTYSGGSKASANSPEEPGWLVIASGTLTLKGSMTFYGLIYAANLQGATGPIVDLGGAVTVEGAIAVDGGGGVFAGANGANVIYDDTVFPELKTLATPGIVQGTWRELRRGQ